MFCYIESERESNIDNKRRNKEDIGREEVEWSYTMVNILINLYVRLLLEDHNLYTERN